MRDAARTSLFPRILICILELASARSTVGTVRYAGVIYLHAERWTHGAYAYILYTCYDIV